MEYITKDIFHWEGKIERTEEEERIADEMILRRMERFIESDPFLKAQREKRSQDEALQAKADSQLAKA